MNNRAGRDCPDFADEQYSGTRGGAADSASRYRARIIFVARGLKPMKLPTASACIKSSLAFTFIATVASINWLSANDALAKRPVPDSVKVACSGDYKRFCGKYQIGTTKLNNCMRANGKRLSSVCVRELVDKGMVPRSLLRKARRR